MSKHEGPAGTETLLDEILADAHGDDEQLRALRQACEDNVSLPADAFVLGEPVSVVSLDYDGNTRRGLTARCKRQDGTEHVVAAWTISFAAGSDGARHLAAYRMWLGIEPPPARKEEPTRRPKRHKATDDDIDLDAPVDLVVLAPKETAARCRILGTQREITLRSGETWTLVPGEIITVHARKTWRFANHPYLTGKVEGHRLDVPALDLVPLSLQDAVPWDPVVAYWREKDEPLEEWERLIIAHGPRTSFEMEQVLPGEDYDSWGDNPILEAIERTAAGDSLGAEKLVVEMLAADLRCLDAHAHLGTLTFDHDPERAVRHYKVGVSIGALSLTDDFDDLLPWDRTDNRPFLRCLHGLGLCLWRLGQGEEAAALFEQMLWLNPSDNQGARILLPQVCAGERWQDHDDER